MPIEASSPVVAGFLGPSQFGGTDGDTDGLTEAEGLLESEALRDGLRDADGDKLADGDIEADSEALGL